MKPRIRPVFVKGRFAFWECKGYLDGRLRSWASRSMEQAYLAWKYNP